MVRNGIGEGDGRNDRVRYGEEYHWRWRKYVEMVG